MQIIISPAKKMRVDNDDIGAARLPVFLTKTEELLTALRALDYRALQNLWQCNDAIAELNYSRLQRMDLRRNLTPAVFSYDGLQYQHLAPNVLDEAALAKNLYAFWGRSLYDELVKNDGEVLNLASKEYSKAVEPYVTGGVRFVTCVFGSLQNGKIKVKATEAKMARGEMVRCCAEVNVQHIDEVKNFTVNGYSFAGELSGANEFVFLK